MDLWVSPSFSHQPEACAIILSLSSRHARRRMYLYQFLSMRVAVITACAACLWLHADVAKPCLAIQLTAGTLSCHDPVFIDGLPHLCNSA